MIYLVPQQGVSGDRASVVTRKSYIAEVGAIFHIDTGFKVLSMDRRHRLDAVLHPPSCGA